MEITPMFLLSTFAMLINLVVLGVGLTAYLVQLKPRLDHLEKEYEQAWAEMQRHKENDSIHFNEKVTKQVDEKYNQRFQMIENKLGKMDEKIDKLLERK